MKKILSLILISIMLLLSTGCSNNELDNFEHYNLTHKKVTVYKYTNDNKKTETYVLSDITTGDMLITTGLFYKLKDNDYILLAKLESQHQNAYKNKSIYQFYNNKLYGVGDGDTPMIFEIELKGTESKINELKLKLADKTNPFLISSIESIDNETISLTGEIFVEEYAPFQNLNCSLKNYECQVK